MTVEFYWMIAEKGIYDTRKYRYVARFSLNGRICRIYRAERKALESKLALMGNPWELVKIIYK